MMSARNPGKPLPDWAVTNMRILKIPTATRILEEELAVSGTSELLEAVLRRQGAPIVFAGAVRDALWSIEVGVGGFKPRDFDIGVLGMSRGRFHALLRDLGGARNRYGGYRLTTSSRRAVDIWRLEDTWGLRATNAAYSIDNVLRTFVLDINAIAFDLSRRVLFDEGSLDSIRSRTLGLVQGALLHSAPTFAAKAIVTAVRFSLTISASLVSLIETYLDRKTLAYESSKVFGKGSRVHKRILGLHADPTAESSPCDILGSA